MQTPLIFSRRRALLIAGAGLTPWSLLFAGEFWDKKDPGQWTPDEKDLMLTKSPWAKQVTAQATADPESAVAVPQWRRRLPQRRWRLP